jgi:hypothetical protein
VGPERAREDVAAAASALIAMSGQFEQRRLARPRTSSTCSTRSRRRQLRRAPSARLARARSGAARHDELTRDARAPRRGSPSCARSSRTPRGWSRGDEDELRASASGCGTSTELARGAARRRRGARARRRRGRRRPRRAAPSARSRRSSGSRRSSRGRRRAARRRAAPARDRVRAARVPRLARGRAGPARAGRGELDRIADAKRRFRAQTYESCSSAREEARARARRARRTASIPPRAAAAALAAAQARRRARTRAARGARGRGAPFAEAVAAELAGVGLGDGEFRVELASASRRDRRDEVAFLIRPNPGPAVRAGRRDGVGRRALAHRARDRGRRGGETMVFDEIDAGIGGETAHAVAETLRGSPSARR